MPLIKICKHCGQEKPVNEFEIKYQKDSKNICSECYRKETIERQKKSYRKLREKRLAYQKQYDANSEKKRLYIETHREKNRQYAREYGRQYRKKQKLAKLKKNPVNTGVNLTLYSTPTFSFPYKYIFN